MNARFQLIYFFLWLYIWRLACGSPNLFCNLSLHYSFIFFSEIIVQFIYLDKIKSLHYDTTKRLETTTNITNNLSWILWWINLAQYCLYFLICISNLQLLTSCLLVFNKILAAFHHLNIKKIFIPKWKRFYTLYIW